MEREGDGKDEGDEVVFNDGTFVSEIVEFCCIHLDGVDTEMRAEFVFGF